MIKFFYFILFLTPALLSEGCATTAETQCAMLLHDGKIIGTLASCKQCIDTLGPSNLSSIQGCSLGLDAAKLIDPDS